MVIISTKGSDAETRPQPISISIVYEPVENGWTQARIEGIPVTARPTASSST
jgi:hypothetical protein